MVAHGNVSMLIRVLEDWHGRSEEEMGGDLAPVPLHAEEMYEVCYADFVRASNVFLRTQLCGCHITKLTGAHSER